MDEIWIVLQSSQITLKITNSDLKEAKESIKRLKDKLNSKDEIILEQPTFNLKQIESALKLWDKFILNSIIEYLKLDSFEFAKQIAGTINKDNVSEVMAYKDGALQRNESLIRFLSKFAKENEKINKIFNERI